MATYYKFQYPPMTIPHPHYVLQKIETEHLEWQKQYAQEDSFCLVVLRDYHRFVYYSTNIDSNDDPIFNNEYEELIIEQIEKEEFVNALKGDFAVLGSEKWFQLCKS